jgi:hypothetical protein
MLDTSSTRRFLSVGKAVGDIAERLQPRPDDASQRDRTARSHGPVHRSFPEPEQADLPEDTVIESGHPSPAEEEADVEQQGSRTIMINGQPFVAPGKVTTARELKDAAGIDPSRNLIRQRPDGNEFLSDDQELDLKDGDHVSEIPTFRYG